MAASEQIPVEVLHDLLVADFEAGILFWKRREARHFPSGKRGQPEGHAEAFNKRFSGRQALTARNALGYFSGRINHKNVAAHRVIWAMANGRWPNGQIDHVNGNPSDNRLANLRECTGSQNMMNQGPKKGRYRGVYFSKNANKWHAQIGASRKSKHIGYFDTEDDAARAYDLVAADLHGEFARLNFPVQAVCDG